ncbi:Superfamily I DNA and RNA helicase-like protein [Kribbella flavida DSM 17836]|uniref:Superfamily I DNA and RNA helicase-like protein n=1 Tax=Kribbella flavida (strain DSM 17836 / JCM 10339 / NBRC 14399) TaxID=479435 RepID=D2PQ09_KRIFD|nr:AAA family ATPase [Kribbella flavida]ADB32933.1 Superfamily I DNA and RNA helicase-like protein [Kribbella flavida DSM 17836]
MAEPALIPTHSTELEAERAFLAEARDALARMHQAVEDRDVPLIGGEDNDERFTNESNLLARRLRTLALRDLPDVPLFFGLLDYEPGTIEEIDRIHIGRRHVHDGSGAPLVIDWRAPVSVPFYRATRSDRQRVVLRRRYGFSDTAELTGFEDEPLIGAAEADQADAFLRAEIERPRTGPMRDIVATIQPEQDDLVRAPLHPSVCVQGAPGTGKTAVGLHRVAYLLYTERERLSRGGVVIVGPNRSFLSYIRKVLPALGEVDVRQITIEELITRPAAGSDPPEAARTKGDARIARVLERALWSFVGTPTDGVMYTKGSYRYRVHDYEVAEMVTSLRGSMKHGPGRDALAQRIAHAVLVLMERRGESPDDRVQNAVARSKPVKALVDAVWPRVAPEQVLHRLLSNADFLAECAGDDLTADECAALVWPRAPRSWKSAKWSVADTVLLDELDELIERRQGSLGHLVIDEAQDLSAMQLRALGRRCRSGSATVLGDLAQATTSWAAGPWDQVLAHLQKADAVVAELDRGFRVPDQIIAFAAKLLPQIAPTLGVPRGVRAVDDALSVVRTEQASLPDALAAACRAALAGQGSVALIAADEQIAGLRDTLTAAGLEPTLLGETEETARLTCVPASLAKGLEFDAVVVAEPARIVSAEPRGLQRLYVVLTRAVSRLQIVHAEPLPSALSGEAADAEPDTP